MRQYIAPKTPDYRQFRERALLDGADQVLDLLGVGTEILGKLVEIGIGYRDEARFVDIGYHFHADRLQLVLRLMLELDRFGGLGLVDLIGGGLHPALLFRRDA